MSNKNKQIIEKIVTVADLATVNNRDDDSLSFISGGKLLTEENRNDHTTRIITTSDGKVWVQPANGGSEIDLTQAALSDLQIRNINDIPNISDELRNQALPTLEKHISLINDRSTITVNDVQDQRLDSLENDVIKLNDFNGKTSSHLNDLENRTIDHSNALNALRGNNTYSVRINRFNARLGQSASWTNLLGEVVTAIIWNPRRGVRVGDNGNNSLWTLVMGQVISAPKVNNEDYLVPLNYSRFNTGGNIAGGRHGSGSGNALITISNTSFGNISLTHTFSIWSSNTANPTTAVHMGNHTQSFQEQDSYLLLIKQRPMSSVFVSQTLGIEHFGYTLGEEIQDEKEAHLENELRGWNKQHHDAIDEYYILLDWVEYYKNQKLLNEHDNNFIPEYDNIFDIQYKKFDELREVAKVKVPRFNEVKRIREEHNRVWDLKSNELEEHKKYLRDNNLIKSEYKVYNCYDQVIGTYVDYKYKEEQKDNMCPIKFLEENIKIKNKYSEKEIKEKINQLREIIEEEKKQGLH